MKQFFNEKNQESKNTDQLFEMLRKFELNSDELSTIKGGDGHPDSEGDKGSGNGEQE